MKGNGRGPEDKGPKTGRGLGFCFGWGKPGYANMNIAGAGSKPEGGFGHKFREKYHKPSELSD